MTLGIAGVLVSLAVLAVNHAPNAAAQEHPYVVHLNEQCRLPGCAVLPATQQECKEIRSQQNAEETERYSLVFQSLQDRRAKLIGESLDIFIEERQIIQDEWTDRDEAAAKKAAAAVVAAQAQLVACELAIATFTGPAFWTAQALCLTKHTVALAGIYSVLEKVKNDAAKDARNETRLAEHEMDDRNDLINERMDARENAAQQQHAAILADIEAEYQKCLD